MTNKLRSTTNLVVPGHLQLDRKDMKKSFMYVYSAAYPGLEPVFMNRLWLSSFFPQIVKDPTYGKDRKGIRSYAQAAEKSMKAGLLKLKKVNDPADPHFVVAVPLAEFNRYDLPVAVSRLSSWFTKGGSAETDEHVDALVEELKSSAQDSQVQQRNIMGKDAIARMTLDANSKLALSECLFGLRLVYSGGLAVVYADFKINKGEAQQLTTTEWAMIRNMDLYPLLLQWQVSLWGYRGNAPTSSFPMSKVSRTLPPVVDGQARVNEFGLSISPDGSCLWLPEKLDNTARYEDLYAQVGDRGDDTFSLIDMVAAGTAVMTGEELKVKLPANIPVLIDWVNNRYAYTQSNGVLKVQDLTRFKAADAAHASNLLRHWSLDIKTLKMMVDMGTLAGVRDVLFFTQEEAKEIQENDPVVASRLTAGGGVSIAEYWEAATMYFDRFVGKPGSLTLSDISIEGDPIWRPLARYIETAQAAVIANMDAVNQKFSVSGTATRLGMMTLMAKYGNDLTSTLAKSNSIRGAAQNQGVDPKWSPESIPLIMDNPERPFSLLPHQAKVRNILKDSPDFAILPVQAGGGKTPLAIIDILMEIKANRSQPYLVLCPSALVSQYVKEVTYFTSGKVNCIPIVSDTIFRNGFDRLKQMIENAPRNTIVIVNYDVLRNKAYDVCYGTTNVKIYPVIEFLRQFNFGYAMMDESHNLKNDSQRTRAALQLIADIPKKRLASGTMAHDSPSDLALQVAMLDPTLFGSRENFNLRFAAEGKDSIKGGRVMQWRPGAQQQIMSMIKSRIVVAGAMRKEWAALLPTSVEKMHIVNLTENQHAIYTEILMLAFEKMQEDAKSNPALKKFFEGQGLALEAPQKKGNEGEDEEADEEAEDAADESAGADLEGMLGFYLARIEQFLTAPGRDELGAAKLSGDDLRSPKVNKILTIIEEHIAAGVEGKVLVFTNYIDSAEEIFEAASPALRAQGILYTASDKVEAGAAFESSASKKWMVGVENSMNTGLNFQHVSRLIRVENVWNPGTLEQGNSRINRPEMKKADRRENIYFDWIAANKTYDITKISRLISKIIAIAKFENADNPAYEELPDVPVIPMSADAILARNTQADLVEYVEAYAEHNQVKFDDYQEYRKKHGNLTLTPLTIAPRPKDAALMLNVPYVPGLTLYKGEEHGLIRVDEYVRMNDNGTAEEGEGDSEGEDDTSNLTPQQRKRQALADALVGQLVHTEFGDGRVKSISLKAKRLNLVMPNGYLMRVFFSAAFVMTKGAIRKQTARQQILKGVSNDMPIVDKVTIMSPKARPDKAGARMAERQRLQEEKDALNKKAEEELETKLNVELQFNVSNGFLGIAYYPEEGSDASKALQALGFRPVEPYVFAEVKSDPILRGQFAKWKKAGFKFEEKFGKLGAIQAIANLSDVLKSGQMKTGAMNYRFSSKNQLVNFFRMELRPSANPKEFKPYPMIEDGVAYLVMHIRGQAGTKAAMQVRSPGIRWHQSAEHLVYYGLNAEKIAAKMKEILASGIQIMNLPELQKEFKKLKKQKIRNED